MQPTTYKAIHVDDFYAVVAQCGDTQLQVATRIRSEETARIIARLLNLNSYSADVLESGEVEIVNTSRRVRYDA